MGEVDVKAYLCAEDFRLHTDMVFWRKRWEQSQSLWDYDRYQAAAYRYQQFNEFRKAVLACFDISDE